MGARLVTPAASRPQPNGRAFAHPESHEHTKRRSRRHPGLGLSIANLISEPGRGEPCPGWESINCRATLRPMTFPSF
jgi:hypothetical protein